MKSIIRSGILPVAITALVLLGSTPKAQSQTISWSMDRWGFTLAPGNNGGLPVPNTTAGVVPAVNWNDAWNEGLAGSTSATVNNLWNSLGNNSGASITWSCADLWQIQQNHTGADADGTYNREMLNGYLDSNSGASTSSTIAISVIPYSAYDLYVYFSSDTAGRAGTVSLGGTPFDFSTIGPGETSGASAVLTQTTDTTGGNPSADYAVFTDLTGTSQTITSLVNGGGGIAAFQIVATPEPGTMALAVMGGFGVLLLKRRFQKN